MTPLPYDYTRCAPELPGQQCDKCCRYAKHPDQVWGERTSVLHGVEAPGAEGCDYIPEGVGKREHIMDASCWCHPELNYKDPDNDAEVWVHKEPT